jgi:hypothetical protein
MKISNKILLSLLLIISVLNPIPAQANACNLPFLMDSAAGSKKTGTIATQVLFVKFADSAKKSKTYTKQHMANIDLKEMNNYIKETSYGKAKLKFNINYSWITLPGNSYEYGIQGSMSEQDENNYRDAIISAADSSIDFSKSDNIWVIPDPDIAQF